MLQHQRWFRPRRKIKLFLVQHMQGVNQGFGHKSRTISTLIQASIKLTKNKILKSKNFGNDKHTFTHTHTHINTCASAHTHTHTRLEVYTYMNIHEMHFKIIFLPLFDFYTYLRCLWTYARRTELNTLFRPFTIETNFLTATLIEMVL